MSDELRDIPGFEGRYAAAADGRFWSRLSGKWIKPFRVGKGYLGVKLHSASKEKNYRVHRLIALAWIPNPDSLPLVNHLDGDKHNNAVCNLEWCDARRNAVHAIECGLSVVPTNRNGRPGQRQLRSREETLRRDREYLRAWRLRNPERVIRYKQTYRAKQRLIAPAAIGL